MKSLLYNLITLIALSALLPSYAMDVTDGTTDTPMRNNKRKIKMSTKAALAAEPAFKKAKSSDKKKTDIPKRKNSLGARMAKEREDEALAKCTQCTARLYTLSGQTAFHSRMINRCKDYPHCIVYTKAATQYKKCPYCPYLLQNLEQALTAHMTLKHPKSIVSAPVPVSQSAPSSSSSCTHTATELASVSSSSASFHSPTSDSLSLPSASLSESLSSTSAFLAEPGSLMLPLETEEEGKPEPHAIAQTNKDGDSTAVRKSDRNKKDSAKAASPFFAEEDKLLVSCRHCGKSCNSLGNQSGFHKKKHNCNEPDLTFDFDPNKFERCKQLTKDGIQCPWLFLKKGTHKQRAIHINTYHSTLETSLSTSSTKIDSSVSDQFSLPDTSSLDETSFTIEPERIFPFVHPEEMTDENGNTLLSNLIPEYGYSEISMSLSMPAEYDEERDYETTTL